MVVYRESDGYLRDHSCLSDDDFRDNLWLSEKNYLVICGKSEGHLRDHS